MKLSCSVTFTLLLCFVIFLVSANTFAAGQNVSIKIESFSASKMGPTQTSAAFWRARGESKNKSVLLVHMLGRSKEDWAGFAAKLSTQGYDVLAVDLRNKGSGGNQRLIEDIQSSVIFLRSQADTEKQKVVLIGASIGANGVAQYASSTRQMHLLVDSMILLSPGELYKDTSLLDALRKTAVIPTLLVAAEDDAYSAETVKKAIKTCTSICKEHLFSSGGHGTQLLHSNNSQKLEDLIASFVEEHK